jgi:hypothetical protein
MFSALATGEAHELRGKYVEMLAMRLAHASGGEIPAQARSRMIVLAKRFPGALREIDDLELADIRRRISDLGDVASGARDAQPWMVAMSLFHQLARGALCVKRWLCGRKRVDPHLERAFGAQVSALDFADEARLWENDLAAIASPPDGRIMTLVYARVGRVLGMSDTHVRHAVFGVSRRHRHGGACPSLRGELECQLEAAGVVAGGVGLGAFAGDAGAAVAALPSAGLPSAALPVVAAAGSEEAAAPSSEFLACALGDE